MTEKNVTITVHTRERMVIRNLDGLDLRCGNCGANVDLAQMSDPDIQSETIDRPDSIIINAGVGNEVSE